MAWIEVHQSLWDHRKTLLAAEILGMPELYVAAHLIALWTWAIDNAPDGRLPASRRIIARGARWDGDPDRFVGAMVEAGWFDDDGDGLAIHDFDSYIGKLVDQRRRNAQRQAAFRERHRDDRPPVTSHESNSDVTVTSALRNRGPNRTVPNSTEPTTTRAGAREAERPPGATPPYRELLNGKYERMRDAFVQILPAIYTEEWFDDELVQAQFRIGPLSPQRLAKALRAAQAEIKDTLDHESPDHPIRNKPGFARDRIRKRLEEQARCNA